MVSVLEFRIICGFFNILNEVSNEYYHFCILVILDVHFSLS